MTAQGAARIYRTWMKRWHIQERFSQIDWSIVDLWLARKLFTLHISPTQVEAIIRLGSPNFPRHHGDPVDYLRRTLARAALPIPTSRPVCSTHVTAPRTPRQLIDPQCREPRWPSSVSVFLFFLNSRPFSSEKFCVRTAQERRSPTRSTHSIPPIHAAAPPLDTPRDTQQRLLELPWRTIT